MEKKRGKEGGRISTKRQSNRRRKSLGGSESERGCEFMGVEGAEGDAADAPRQG